MKNLILFFLLATGISFTACSNSDSGSATEQAPMTSQESGNAEAPKINIINDANKGNAGTNSTNGFGEKHYICPNGCEGSGGDTGGACPVCGTAYVHNQAFHNNTTAPSTGNDPTSPVINPTTSEPAQNANGVWHYTCPNGCSGGGASGTPCGQCGATLVHNAAYHQ